MDQKNLDPETVIMDQFLDPETDIMGEGNYIQFPPPNLSCFPLAEQQVITRFGLDTFVTQKNVLKNYSKLFLFTRGKWELRAGDFLFSKPW